MAKNTEKLKEHYQKIRFKTEQKETNKLREELKRFAPYEDFKELYNKTLVPMQRF